MADTVIAPTTGTFSAGHDVIGLAGGTTGIPTELSSWEPYPGFTGNKPKTALIIFNSSYSTSHTYAQVKYWFLTAVRNPGVDESLVLGAVVVPNANAAPTVYGIDQIVEVSLTITGSGGGPPAVGPASLFQVRNHSNNPIFKVLEDDTAGDGAAMVLNNAQVATVQLLSNLISGIGPYPYTGAVFTLASDDSVVTSQTPNPA